MHLLIPFAAPLSDAGRQAPGCPCELPNLRRCWPRLPPEAVQRASAATATSTACTPPHERALARALGWPAADGQLPFAAWHAADGMACPTRDPGPGAC
jgi:hypothetical protein